MQLHLSEIPRVSCFSQRGIACFFFPPHTKTHQCSRPDGYAAGLNTHSCGHDGFSSLDKSFIINLQFPVAAV